MAPLHLPRSVLLYGSEESLPETIPLRCGPLSMFLEDGGLRYVRLGSCEVVRGIYAAVRDRNWGTVPGRLRDLDVQTEADSFSVHFSIDNCRDEIQFGWHGAITGDADGRVAFSMEGVAHSSFLKSRIGFCVLHPVRECAGAACRIRHADGTTLHSQFPRYIARETPFREIASIAYPVAPGVWAELEFEGDIFEMEDQRNWTDASFKTFCTPLRLPFPVQIAAGEKVSQRVTLTLEGAAVRLDATEGLNCRSNSPSLAPSLKGGEGLHSQHQFSAPGMNQPHDLSVGAEPVGRLPQIGFEHAGDLGRLTDREVERLRRLAPAHLRVEVRLWEAAWASSFLRIVQDAERIGVPVEVALFLSGEAETELADWVRRLRERRPNIARWLVFHSREWSTSRRWIELARQFLGGYDGRIPLGSGTNANFAQLNQVRPPVDAIDFVAWPIQPQEHAFDNASLVETLEMQAATVTSARQFVGALPIIINPITIGRRLNPVATGVEPPPDPTALPPSVDVRQMSLFGAAWTLGSVKYLAESRVAAATYYQTMGWRGVMEREAGSLLPSRFRSLPGAVFPMYHVFADLAEFASGDVLPVSSSDPLSIDGLALVKDGQPRILLANMTSAEQTVAVRVPFQEARLRQLDERTVLDAMAEPESFRRREGTMIRSESGVMRLELLPYAYARIDCPLI